MGGVFTVVGMYRRAGLFDRWPITYFSSHTDAGSVGKLVCAGQALSSYLKALLRGKIAIGTCAYGITRQLLAQIFVLVASVGA